MNGTAIIAVDYYDGPTDGFARSVRDIGPCYFKLIAWDENQDQRLFAAVAIGESEFELVFERLGRARRSTDARVQIATPGIVVGSGGDDALERMIRRCQARIRDSGVLLLGLSIDGPETVLVPTIGSLRDSVDEALGMETPEDLTDWLPQLS